MPKIKTRKSLAKKVKVTKNNKVLRRYTKQNHLNAKERGAFKRKKRRSARLFKGDERNVIKALTSAN